MQDSNADGNLLTFWQVGSFCYLGWCYSNSSLSRRLEWGRGCSCPCPCPCPCPRSFY